MAGMRIINFGGGSGMPADFLDDNGKIKMEYIPAGVTSESIRSTNAGNTPKDIVWYDDGGNEITGTLVASEETMNEVYFIKRDNYYDQYMTLKSGSSYGWSKTGTTLVNSVSGITYKVVEVI